MPEAADRRCRSHASRARSQGSLAQLRPDEMGAMVRMRCSSATRGRSGVDRGPLLRLRATPGPAGVQHRAHHRSAVRAPADGRERGDDPRATAPRASSRFARPPTPSWPVKATLTWPPGSSGSRANERQEVAGAADQNERLQGRNGDRTTPTSPWESPLRTWPRSRGQPRGHGQVHAALGRSSPSARRRTASSTGRSSPSSSPTAARWHGTTARARARRSRSCRSWSPPSRGGRRHRRQFLP